MDDSRGQLVQEAIQISNGFAEHKRGLEREKVDLKNKLAQIEANLEATNLAIDRPQSFRADIGGQFQCPRCWIAHERQSTLVAIRSATEADEFQCRSCDFGFTIWP